MSGSWSIAPTMIGGEALAAWKMNIAYLKLQRAQARENILSKEILLTNKHEHRPKHGSSSNMMLLLIQGIGPWLACLESWHHSASMV